MSVAVASSVRGFMRLLCGGWLLHGCASATASTRPPKVAVVDARWCIGGEEIVAAGWSVPYGADRRFEGAHDRFRGRAVLRRARRDIRRGHPNAARARLLREGSGDHAYAAALGHTAIGDAQFGDPRTRNSACADYGRAMSLLGIGFFGHFRAGTSPDRGLTSYLGYMLAWCSATQPLEKRDRARFEVDPWDAHILRFVVALRSSAREVRDLDEYAGLHEMYEGTLERVFALVPEDREACVRNVGTGHPVDCSALSFGRWDAASLCGR